MSRILVVDDQEEIRMVLRAILEAGGHEVTMCTNGVEALEQAERQVPDAVVTDGLMPLMDGFMLRRRCASEPALKHVPFIMYTATSADTNAEAVARSLGFRRFLIKPQPPEVLLGAVEEVLTPPTTGSWHGVGEPRPDGLAGSGSPAGSSSGSLTQEMEVLRRYNETLFQALSARMNELELEIAERRRIEDQIRNLNAELEARVSERTAELERANRELQARAEELAVFNRSMMGREERVIELKEEVNRLCRELGRPPDYPPIWDHPGTGGRGPK